jgi:integrase
MAAHPAVGREPWNKGKLVRQKAPFKLRAIRIRLQLAQRKRELALFNLAIDSKLRACDLVKLLVRDVCHADRVSARAIVKQQKTQRPVQFEITDQTRMALAEWIKLSELRSDDFVFPGHKESPRGSIAVWALGRKGAGRRGPRSWHGP